MRIVSNIIVLIFLISCYSENTTNKTIFNNVDSLKNVKIDSIQYSSKQLQNYLDSVGQLDSKDLIEKVSFYTDSIFKNRQSLNFSLESNDFIDLKIACKSKKIDLKFARKIFKDLDIDTEYLKQDMIPLTFISFDKNKDSFDEFAIWLGFLDWRCDLYFFKGNKIISKHKIYHRYGLELNYYKDFDGKIVVYYKENYQSGSGIWWFNYYFYKYDGYNIVPILNELENANLQYPWHIRALWFESKILKTNPLTIKMIYYQDLPDSSNNIHRIINDSTIVKYRWDIASKKLIGDYSKSKISKAQIVSYYLSNNELLFINSYNKLLKDRLQDSLSLRQAILKYLSEVKAHYDKIKK